MVPCKRVLAFFLAIVLGTAPLIALASPSVPCRYQIQAGDEGNLVVFESKAPLESFKGKTDRIAGSFVTDLAQLVDSLRFRIEVDLTSLDTGIGLRNQHMRDNHLETDRFPAAVFSGGRIVSTTSPSLKPGTTAKIRLAGDMHLHGITRAVEMDVELVLDQSGILQVTSQFSIYLSDYDIKRPQFLVMKLADDQKVNVKFRAHPVAAGQIE